MMRKNIRSALLLIASLFVSGCTPPLEPSRTGDVAHCPHKSWEPYFPIRPPKYLIDTYLENPQPLSACELLDLALMQNPLTKRSWHIARASAFNVGVARSALYPSIDSSVTYSVTKINGPGSSSTETGASTGTDRFIRAIESNINLNYLLFDFGGRQANIEAAQQALLSADWIHNRTIQDVMIAVLDAYYAYLAASADLEAREQDEKDARETLEAAKQQFEAGVVTKIDSLQAEANHANTKLQLAIAQGNVHVTMGRLAKAVGFPANTELPVVSLPKECPVEEVSDDMEELMAAAVTKRADLAAAYSDYRVALKQIVIAHSAGLPTISTELNATRVDVLNHPNLSNQVYSGAITVNIPIFSGFLYEYQTARARANACAAYFNWKDKKANVLLEVLISYYNYVTSIEAIKYSAEYLKFAQEAFNATLLGYRLGTQSILNVLVAQTTLSDARSQDVQARIRFYASLAQVAYTTGTL
jgi:outer membrane protein